MFGQKDILFRFTVCLYRTTAKKGSQLYGFISCDNFGAGNNNQQMSKFLSARFPLY